MVLRRRPDAQTVDAAGLGVDQVPVESLLLPEPVRGQSPLGDVGVGAVHGQRLAGRVKGHDPAAVEDPAPLAALVAHAVFGLVETVQPLDAAVQPGFRLF